MTDLESRLQARITAQNLMIEALLEAAIKAGQLDPKALVESLERYVDGPAAPFANPVEIEVVRTEVEAWADMVFDRYCPDSEMDPTRSPK